MRSDSQRSLNYNNLESASVMDLPADAALDMWGSLGDPLSPRFPEPPDSPLAALDERFLSKVPGKAEAVVLAKMLWASPWSVWGLSVGCLGLLTGGRVQRSGRLIEFWGGFLPLFLRYFPFIAGSPVATFGHVVLGRSQRHLDACRPHQLVHVGQYERWGLLFVPAYLTWWVVLWCCGKRPYYDNPFERQAFDQTS
ncbi:MAG: hypothetical protein JXB10_02870 [Pirellulales bacterium]|nr:hypothetical protein [Pirellulales bacterium]